MAQQALDLEAFMGDLHGGGDDMGAIHVSKLLGAMLARWKASGVCKEDVVSYAKDYLQWDAEGQEVWKLMAAYEEVADMHLVW
eukprot:CAMPEP_0174362172 /NCGR_PEP_ID=MMETSP0811_2-20130205/63067_1 /TAXON_ID=73025 ORGANISM="Eutreptiella gymnastica-like, Strain CCMP1594" /NCGR_SAMPLE_ID=MMETSP0811_2 /ASSEMBLY_ACC=CAM_ASM_000667 /LENGTH=82 /DNA_ID=CAMNT_0015499589 /DNA_START=87 /DNA_END=333 /DNA_ORIENTATION=+